MNDYFGPARFVMLLFIYVVLWLIYFKLDPILHALQALQMKP
jgi:hypothetical protein